MRLSTNVLGYAAAVRDDPRNQRQIRHVLSRLVTAADDPRLDELGPEHMLAWWASTADLAPSSRRTHRSVISCYLAWLRRCGWLDTDPLSVVPRVPKVRHAPRTLTPNEVSLLLERADGDPRLAAVLALMYGLGLRCVDISRLQTDDIDRASMIVTVVGKGRHTDLLPLPKWVAEALDRYVTRWAGGPLIRNERRGFTHLPLSAQRISEIVAIHARECGVKRSCHDGRGAHALRRTLATELLADGANIRQVQAVLRHASLQSTEHYLRRAEVADLRPVLERHRPVA